MSSKAKTRYLAERSLYRFVKRNPLFYYWTNSFAGEGVQDKTEAERRLKPLKDMLRRKGADAQFFWEQHPGGHGWHLHWVTSKYLDVKDFRAWMMLRGWGQQMKVRYVRSSPALFNGQTWVTDESAVRGVVNYLIKYVTKDIVGEFGSKKKVWSCCRACKAGNVRFAWVPWMNPTSYLYFYGRQMFYEIYGRYAGWKDFSAVVRLGVENTNWLETDPWWMPAGP